MSALHVSRLDVVRGRTHALKSVSLDVEAGTVTGLLGPSGSGKTTLLRSIVGVQVIRRGTVEVLGLSAGSPELRSRVGYVTQAPSVYFDLTVRENLAYFGRIAASPPEREGEVLETVGLAAQANQVVATMSGGEKSRVSLATALLARPEVLILDEPTVGLDPVLRRDLWAMFHRLADERTTVLVSTHVMDEAERCDDLVLIRSGHVVAHAPPAEILRMTGARNVDEAFLALVEET